jgi:hypothetical protein
LFAPRFNVAPQQQVLTVRQDAKRLSWRVNTAATGASATLGPGDHIGVNTSAFSSVSSCAMVRSLRRRRPSYE